MNPLIELQQYGQSFWYDNIRRGLLTSGGLKRMIDEDGLRGMTSNPTIFEKAIGESSDYDEAIRALVERDLVLPIDMYEELAVADIQAAADTFRPLYDRERSKDGYVCLEVSPLLARNTDATIAEAERLWKWVKRPNVMIKVPSTPEGIPAIEHLIGRGINVNVTLMFSMETYERVYEAVIRGLEKRAGQGQDVSRIASVASLFVSRVDTAVDKLLEQKGAPGELFGKAAIANSKVLYERFKQIFHGPRFAALLAKGAQPQRLLWASTSTKNPKYRDVMYAEALIGPGTVDTMPDVTVAAFRDHGRAAATLEQGVDEARLTLDQLAEAGIDLAAVLKRLQDEGVTSFADSFEKLMATLAKKRQAILAEAGKPAATHKHPRVLDENAMADVERMAKEAAKRLWDRDTTLWTGDNAVAAKIRNRLGWLVSPRNMQQEVGAIQDFAAEARAAGFTSAVLMGMGGSSLCPEVCRNVYGVAPGCPELRVLDTTDPDAITVVTRSVSLDRTLFINASKSGATIEPSSLEAFFWNKRPNGGQFMAITDPGTALDKEAQQKKYRRVFRNAPDIGGRYSALSYFGLVPAALLGVDIGALLARAEDAVRGNSPGALDESRRREMYAAKDAPEWKNGVGVGTILGALALQGRDKLTFVMSPAIADFGNWVEQLIAESTGKEGKGILPVVGEPLGDPDVYGNDRVFMALEMEGDRIPGLMARRMAFERAGHPFFYLPLRDKLDLGAEFFRWEVATAVMGAMLKINPFDEPNVTESKENTARLLKAYEAEHRLPQAEPARLRDVQQLLDQGRPGDYIALLAFTPRNAETIAQLGRVQAALRDSTRLAATVGFGPRYLHSTGQFHKGGPNTGLFIFITADDAEDLPIPGRPYSFGTLNRAQALGDLEALRNHGRRVIHLHLGKDIAGGLGELEQLVSRQTHAAD